MLLQKPERSGVFVGILRGGLYPFLVVTTALLAQERNNEKVKLQLLEP